MSHLKIAEINVPKFGSVYLGSGQPIGLMQKMKHDAPGAAADGPPLEWDRYVRFEK